MYYTVNDDKTKNYVPTVLCSDFYAKQLEHAPELFDSFTQSRYLCPDV